jgi:ABC-type branched-subunit amino acid transport system permease subunit
MLFIVILFAAFLGACSSVNPNPTAAPTAVSASTSPYDGAWVGSGKAQDGREITVKFTVANGGISSFIFSYPKPDHSLDCTGLDHANIPRGSRPLITNNSFSQTFGPDLTADGTFTSPTSASGHISLLWQGHYTSGCSASLQAAWTASKQQAVITTTTAAPVSAGWCGKNVDCSGLLLQLLIFGLVNGSILALNAIGVTVIYSTVRILNLAHGDVFALTTAFVTSVINIIGLNLNWPAGSQIAVLLGVLVGSVLVGTLLMLGVEELAFRPFRGRSKLAPLIASLGLSFILYQGALVWRTYQKSFIRGEHRSVPGLPEVPTDGIPNFLPHTNLLAGKVVLQGSDVFVWAAAILFVLVTTYILLGTDLGKSIRAVAQNEELAQMVGVNRDGAIRRAFALGGALAGAAAFVFALYYSRPFGSDGAESGLIAFAAALLGGIGSAFGALLSGLTLSIVGSFSDYFLSTQWTPVLLLGLLTALLVWRRGGFAGETITDEGSVRDSVVLTAPTQSSSTRRWLIGLLIALAILPVITTVFNLGGEILLRGLGIYILLTLGLNILLGVAGVLDLGYAMSFALGGYVAAVLTLHVKLDFTLVLLLSALLAGLFGLLKGSASTRLRGDYLAVATLALGLMTQQVIVNAADLTGGASGLSAVPPPHLLGFVLAAPSAEYYLVFVVVLLAAFASGRLMSSRTGRAWLAASEDETAAASLGINAAFYRQLAFVLSSALAGIAGALYASTFSYIDPDIAAFHVSALLLAMVILGGAGSVTGAILGTVLIYSYDKVLVGQLFALLSLLWPRGLYIGQVPNIRGTNFFDFGIALYLTVLWRARKR